MSDCNIHGKSPVTARIRIFCRAQGIKIAEFERTCGLARGYVCNIRRGISETVCSKIAQSFPELSLDWLLHGTGQMVNRPLLDTEQARLLYMIAERDKRIRELELLIPLSVLQQSNVNSK